MLSQGLEMVGDHRRAPEMFSMHQISQTDDIANENEEVVNSGHIECGKISVC